MQPDNAIIGDATGTDLPVMKVDERDLVEEKQMAEFSKTPEFQRIKQHFEQRIEFYQRYLPDGRPIESVPKADLEAMWVAANAIIGELRNVLDSYELATLAVENAIT